MARDIVVREDSGPTVAHVNLTPGRRAAGWPAAASCRILVVSVSLFVSSCTPGDPSDELMNDYAPAEAIVRSVAVHRHEIREGMRMVSVRVELVGQPTREITVTEWVPIVLFRHLEVGARVQLIRDPAQDRLTIAF